MSYKYGFTWDGPASKRDVLTLEYAGSHDYGDNYFFFDTANLFEEQAQSPASVYGEWTTRLSAKKALGLTLTDGLVTDIYFGGQIDIAENAVAYLWGFSIDLDVPGCDLAQIHAYLRDDTMQPGVTWQTTLVWNSPFSIGGVDWAFGGYVDIAGPEGTSEWNIFSDVQLMTELSERGAKSGRVLFGVQAAIRHSEFGVKGNNQVVPQLMLSVFF